MKCWFGCLLTFTFLCLVSTSARADTIPWTYTWSGPSIVSPDGKGTGSINIATVPGTPPGGGGDSAIAAANLTTFISPTISASDTYTHAAYLLSLNITDSASGDTKTAILGGFFDGTVTAANVSLTNSFDEAPAPLTIGKNVYTVVLDSYKSPGVPGAAPGSIGAHVSVVPAAGADTLVSTKQLVITEVPEPASLLLAGLALPAFGLAYRRRWQWLKAQALVG